MSNFDQVSPVSGDAAPTGPGPAPIPRRQMRFRAAPQPGTAIPQAPPAFPVSTGIGPLLAYADGYNAVEVPRSGLNTNFASCINLTLRVYLTNQKLSVNDKFLKEVSMYHPDAFDLYCSFIFIYHVLRVRSEVGHMSSSESTLLSELLTNYPPSALPVPGTIVDLLQSITTTENPYPWLGNITTALPEVNDFSSPRDAYLLRNNRHLFWPNFKFLISQIIATAARARPNEQTWNTMQGVRFNSPGSQNGNTNAPTAMQTNSVERLWLTTPHGRVPSSLNLRTAQSFHDAISGSPNYPFYSNFAIDLPGLNSTNSTANGTLPSYLGLIDDEGLTNRSMQYRKWPTQLAPMVGTACKYISGSRHLSDIATTGLGSFAHISLYSSSVIFEIRDPAIFQGGIVAQISNATYHGYLLNNLNATLQVRDPVASDLSIQYQMLSQTNVDTTYALDGLGNPLGNLGFLRDGPFWTYAIGENGPESAVANTLLSHLPNIVKANPRRDASE